MRNPPKLVESDQITNNRSIALIDADSIVWTIAYKNKDVDDEFAVQMATDAAVITVLQASGSDTYRGFLGSRMTEGFRHKIAKQQPYKGNRDEEKPDFMQKWEAIIRERLCTYWKFDVVTHIEADDAVSITARQLRENYVVCSDDKDLLQIPGNHYHISGERRFFMEEKDSERFFWFQMLTGDRTDNIRGVPGIGEKKANIILDEADPFFMVKVREKYLDYYGNYYGALIFQETQHLLRMLEELAIDVQGIELHPGCIPTNNFYTIDFAL